ncbi:MAG: AbrB/MazE/SpoVT family DNA-binding domain-containing protein [Aquificae bacterium]|nr:AbrB/MazE/SpoVT family DNA-binding domain-containing protein [Aquificota bacterium]
MVSISRLSSKGQLVIPEKIRKMIGLKEGDFILIDVEEGKIILKKVESIDKFRGILEKPLSDEEMEDAFEEGIARGEL